MNYTDTQDEVEEIAVIGMGCRFPGAADVEQFWRNLRDGVESVSFFSDSELRESGIDPALISSDDYVKAWGVIEDIELFDTELFGYSPTEARAVDPQQRVFLECAWKVFENAGYVPGNYPGLVGVFGGARMSSYVNRLGSDLARVGTAPAFQALMGNDKDYLTTRVSYALNLRGPSVAVQTACSTSLVAVHMACESLRSGECDMALAGGVAISVPRKHGYVHQEGMIFSPDGHCRAFDADAEGIVGGDGVGIVLLKRLSDAVADRDPIDAVIRGSAVNNDGRSKVGYTAPSLEGQVAAISEAQAMADVSPDTIDYIEAHGTATRLGDAIEVEALSRVFGGGAGEKARCAVGSVKTNFGHLDTAAGVAGLIKTVLALKHRQIPPCVHFEKPNPRIDFAVSPFYVNNRLEEWKVNGSPRRAGVSSFGIGGTNAHVVLEEAPNPPRVEQEGERPLHLMTLSARGEDRLMELAGRYRDFLGVEPDPSLSDICFTANVGRSRFSHCMAAAASSREELRGKLSAFTSGEKAEGLVTGYVEKGKKPKIAFLFSGDHTTCLGMGRRLYAAQPAFRNAVNRCGKILENLVDRPLLPGISGLDGETTPVRLSARTQPALFVLEYALAEMWRSWGVAPSFVMGQGVGEYAAACAAGIIGLEDGLKLSVARSGLFPDDPSGYETAVLFTDEERVAEVVAPHAGKIRVAAVEAPQRIVVQGKLETVSLVIGELEAEGIETVRQKGACFLFLDAAQKDVLERFEEVVRGIQYGSSDVGFIGTLTGRPTESGEMGKNGYWCDHLSGTAFLAKGMTCLGENGCDLFLEIGTGSGLLEAGRLCLSGEEPVWLSSLDGKKDDWEQVLGSLGEIYVQGGDVDWHEFDKGYERRRIHLPTSPFERRRCWIEAGTDRVEPSAVEAKAPAADPGEPPGTIPLSTAHPLLGKRLSSVLPLFETHLHCDDLNYIRDHRIYETIVVGGTLFFEMAAAGASELFGTKSVILEGLVIYEPLIFEDDKVTKTAQLLFSTGEEGETTFKVYSRKGGRGDQAADWSLHASGKVQAEGANHGIPEGSAHELEKIREHCKTEVSIDDFYESFWKSGLSYGMEFRGVKTLFRGKGTALGEIELPRQLAREAEPYRIHPVMLDSALQIAMAAIPSEISRTLSKEGIAYMLVGLERIHFYTGEIPSAFYSCATIRPQADDSKWETFIVDYTLHDRQNRLLGWISGMQMKRVRPWVLKRMVDAVNAGSGPALPPKAADFFYEAGWVNPQGPKALTTPETFHLEEPGTWLILADKGGLGERLARFMEERGQSCITVYAGGRETVDRNGALGINPADPRDFTTVLGKAMEAGEGAFRGVLHFWGLDGPQSNSLTADLLKSMQSTGCASVLHLVQAMVDRGPAETSCLYIMTRGAQAVLNDAEVEMVARSPMWGLGGVVQTEHPELNCRMVDLDPSGQTDDLRAVLTALNETDAEGRIAFRNNGLHVPRLFRSRAVDLKMEMNGATFRSDAAYLITGGLGALGMVLARYLVDQGVRYLVLLGRSPVSGESEKILSGFKEAGVRVEVLRADVSQADQLAGALEEITGSMPPLGGVFHLAGVLDDGVLAGQDWQRFERAMAPKVAGAWNLYALVCDLPLDFMVFFSSAGTYFGPAGQGSYAAGNAFLDSLASHARYEGVPALSINWGAWSEVGMASDKKIRELMRSRGMGAIEPGPGMALLGLVLSQNTAENKITCLGIMDVQWPKLLEKTADENDAVFLSEFLKEAGRGDLAPRDDVPVLERLRKAEPELLQGMLEDYLKLKFSELLRLEVDEIAVDRDFIELGLDSLLFLDLTQIVAKDLKIKIAPNEAFEAPYIRALAKRFGDDIKSSDKADGKVSQDVRTALGGDIVPDHENRHEPFELSNIQHAYWIGRSGMLDMGNVSCHFYFEVEKRGFDIQGFTHAWQCLIERHDMLRAVIHPNGLQRILETVPPYEVQVLDLSGETRENCEAKLLAVRDEMSHQVLPSDQWPLFDIRASRMPGDNIRLHFSLELLIADVVSIQIIFKEISLFMKEPDARLEPLKLCFRDYILAQNRLKFSRLYQDSRQYWLDLLPEMPLAPDLPLAMDPGSVTKPRFTSRTFTLDPETWRRLKGKSAQVGLTPSGILLSAYAEVLAVWSKSPRFTIGLAQFNRLPLHGEVMNIIGDFTSVVLLQANISEKVNFSERAKRLMRDLWSNMEHRYFDGVEVMREMARGTGNVMLANMPVVFTSVIGVGQESLKNEESYPWAVLGEVGYVVSQTPQVWLDNQVSERAGSLRVNWDAVEEIFPPGMLDDMFNAYEGLIRDLAEKDKRWLAKSFDMIPTAQLEKRAEVNATEAPVSRELLHTLFEHRAQENPDRTAVVFQQRKLSYGELDDLSGRFAGLLREKGVRPNELVAVVMEKGWEQVVAVLATLRAGGAYLPVDPGFPGGRIRHLLDDGDVKIVLTQSRLEQKLEWPENVTCFSVDAEEQLTGKRSAPKSVQRPGDLAYVIYTSGSTGLPKGVMIDHRGAVNTVLDINRRFEIGSGDRVFALSNLNFDLSVYDIFGTLAAGGTIVIPESSRRKDPAHWIELMEREKVTVWNSVPTLMKMLVAYASGAKASFARDLRLVLLSGEWIPLDLPDKVKTLAKNARLVSLGGATEASIWSIVYPIERVDPEWKSIPYGVPMSNQRFYVLNENMAHCPDGVTGELYIAGIGTAKGYWKDNVKTGGAFIHDSGLGERLYRTGDLGRYLPDGNIEFMGREDFQVKISGHRIELGEIETIMKQYDGVGDSIVTPVDDKLLAGFVVPVPGHALEVDGLTAFLREKLPEYMVPGALRVMEAFPLTPSGKVDRKSLSLNDGTILTSDTPHVAPRTELEKAIARVVMEKIGVDAVGIHDKFFNIGANSLDIVRIQNRLKEVLQQEVSVLALFEYPTVNELANHLAMTGEREQVATPARKKVDARKAFAARGKRTKKRSTRL